MDSDEVGLDEFDRSVKRVPLLRRKGLRVTFVLLVYLKNSLKVVFAERVYSVLDHQLIVKFLHLWGNHL